MQMQNIIREFTTKGLAMQMAEPRYLKSVMTTVSHYFSFPTYLEKQAGIEHIS